MATKKSNIGKAIVVIILIAICGILLANGLYWNIVGKNLLLHRGQQDYAQFSAALPQNDIDNAFFGDSHTRYAVNPRYMNETYNFAIGSESQFFSYFILRKLLQEDNTTITRVFIQIDPNSFSETLAGDSLLMNDVWYWKQYMSYEEMQDITSSSKLSLFLYAHLPFIGRGADAITYLTSSTKTDTYRGWANYTHVATLQEKERGGLALYKRDFAGGVHLNGTMLDYFGKTIELANAHNVSVYLIRYPMAPEYYGLLKQNGIPDPYYKQILTVADSNGNYTVLDYSDLFYGKPQYFNDIDHLNYNGSIAFTKMLAKDLQ